MAMDSVARRLQIKALRANFAGEISFPEICEGMRCEAKTRSGTRCKNSGTSFPSGRCRFHGGKSTGPRSDEGKRRSAQNGMNAKRKRVIRYKLEPNSG
jgi:hypothetical protein